MLLTLGVISEAGVARLEVLPDVEAEPLHGLEVLLADVRVENLRLVVVVPSPLVRIREHRVRLLDFLEDLPRILVPRVLVWVPSKGLLPVGLNYLLLRTILVDLQYFVIISFHCTQVFTLIILIIVQITYVASGIYDDYESRRCESENFKK